MSLQPPRRRARKAFGLVAGSSVVLTAALIGLVSLIAGHTAGVAGRVPFYFLAMAVAFLASLWALDDRRRDGITVLIAAVGIAAISCVLFTLAFEGVLYAASEPGEVFSSLLIVYFFSAAIVCTGLGIWGLRHWREFTGGGL